jgi:hypothetical protein
LHQRYYSHISVDGGLILREWNEILAKETIDYLEVELNQRGFIGVSLVNEKTDCEQINCQCTGLVTPDHCFVLCKSSDVRVESRIYEYGGLNGKDIYLISRVLLILRKFVKIGVDCFKYRKPIAGVRDQVFC